MCTIELEKPSQATSKRVYKQIEVLAAKGIKQHEIKLIILFFCDDDLIARIMNDFRKTCNKAYFNNSILKSNENNKRFIADLTNFQRCKSL